MNEIVRSVLARFSQVKRSREDMHRYQEQMAAFAHENPLSLLLVDMGLGKTVSSLTLISDLLWQTEFDAGPVLIIGPLKVVLNVWPNEIALWRHTAWMSHALIRVDDDDPRLAEASRQDRAKAKERAAKRAELKRQGLADDAIAEALGPMQKTVVGRQIMAEIARSRAPIHIINREQVEWLVNLHGAKWPYRTVIIDESDSFQDHGSHRFKALTKVRRTPGLITRMHLLTATPASESLENLWSQVYLLDLGQRFGKNITAYRRTYFEFNKYNHTYTAREGAQATILEKLSDIALVMKREDYLPRESPTIIPYRVELSPVQAEMVATLEKELIITLPSGVELEAKTAAHLSNMLLQLASGAMYETLLVEDEDNPDGDLKKIKRTHHVHDHKIEALREIYESCRNEGRNLLVSYHFKSTLDRLKKAFPKAVVMGKDGKEEKAWNKGKVPMMFIHPQSAGHGLNLQHGGSTMVVFDLIYSLRYYLQLIGRIDRQGQTKPVVVYILIAKGTRDEDAYGALVDKEDGQAMFFAILKKLIIKYRRNKAKQSEDDEL
jgi:hypothetical protein